MSLNRTFATLRRLLMAGLAVGPVMLTADEPIRFSKPAVELAMPGRELPTLPEQRGRALEFDGASAPSALEQSLQMRRQAIPLPNRRKEEEDESPLARRDPNRNYQREMEKRERRELIDPLKREKEKDKEKDRDLPPWSALDSSNSKRKEQLGSLSPVTSFSWEPVDASRRKNDSDRSGRNSTDREKSREQRERDSLFTSKERVEIDSDPSSSVFELFGSKSKERDKDKPTPQQLERRAAFEKLLNPSAEAVAKGPGSLEPVGGRNPGQPGGFIMPSRPGNSLGQAPEDPTTAFNRQQQYLRGPVFEESFKKYSPPAVKSPATAELPFQSPLNRQPAAREFPTRRL